MEQEKKLKWIRIVGLITLTILVIVGVVLTMYFIQKKDTKEVVQYTQKQIGDAVEFDGYTYLVKDFKVLGENADDTSDVQIEIEIEATKDINISLDDFKLVEGTLQSHGGFNGEINSGDKITFKLIYVVKTDNKLLYLIYKNIKTALGQVQI